MIDQGRHSIVPFYAQGSKKVYYYNFYYLQAVFFCCGLGIPDLCEELNRTNHWHKNTPYSTGKGRGEVGVISIKGKNCFYDKKIKFFFQLFFFFNFWSLKPWIRIGSGSGSVSGSVLASIRILWIRIRIRKK